MAKLSNEELKQMYLSGKNSAQIAEFLGVQISTVTERLRKVNTPMRSRSQRQRKYDANHACFQDYSVESMYFAGLLMADGYIRIKGPREHIGIEIEEKDIELLNAFKDFCSYTGPITRRSKKQKSGKESKMAILGITSPEMIGDLVKFGLKPKKSLTAEIPDEICNHELSSFYFRGIFDGDGCVGTRRGKHCCGKRFATFGGTPAVVSAFQDWTEKLVGIRGGVSKRKDTFWAVNFSYNHIPKIGECLYGDPRGPRLTRKSILFQ